MEIYIYRGRLVFMVYHDEDSLCLHPTVSYDTSWSVNFLSSLSCTKHTLLLIIIIVTVVCFIHLWLPCGHGIQVV